MKKNKKKLEEFSKKKNEWRLIEVLNIKFLKKLKHFLGNALAGMTVRHDLEHFTEGKDVILTLDDAKILDEGNEH